MACLREPCCSAWLLNQNAFVQDPVHLWVATGRKKLTHPLPRAWSLQEIFARVMDLLTSSSFLSYKRNWHPDRHRWEGYFETPVCHLLGLLVLLLSRFSRVQLCSTPWTAAHQAPPSLGFSRQEHWSGLPVPSPMHESEKWKWSHSVVSDS